MCLILHKQNGNLCTEPANWVHPCITSDYLLCVPSVNLHKLSCRSQVYNGKKVIWKAFSQLKTSESLLDRSVRLHKFWQVISTFLYPRGATRIKFAADALNFSVEFCRQNRQITETYVNLPMESHILSTHKFCGAIKKNWWDMHSLCICFVAQP